VCLTFRYLAFVTLRRVRRNSLCFSVSVGGETTNCYESTKLRIRQPATPSWFYVLPLAKERGEIVIGLSPPPWRGRTAYREGVVVVSGWNRTRRARHFLIAQPATVGFCGRGMSRRMIRDSISTCDKSGRHISRLNLPREV